MSDQFSEQSEDAIYPLLRRMPKEIAWGTDDERLKGGDFFGVSREN